jgi:prevent-host-death family protein
MDKASAAVWQASNARAHLPAVMDAALGGVPQVIRKRTGEEVVVVSRAAFDALRPTIKDYLMRGGDGPSKDDPIDQAMAENRSRGVTLLGIVHGRTGTGEAEPD